jgi:hypothetical protein
MKLTMLAAKPIAVRGCITDHREPAAAKCNRTRDESGEALVKDEAEMRGAGLQKS